MTLELVSINLGYQWLKSGNVVAKIQGQPYYDNTDTRIAYMENSITEIAKQIDKLDDKMTDTGLKIAKLEVKIENHFCPYETERQAIQTHLSDGVVYREKQRELEVKVGGMEYTLKEIKDVMHSVGKTTNENLNKFSQDLADHTALIASNNSKQIKWIVGILIGCFMFFIGFLSKLAGI